MRRALYWVGAVAATIAAAIKAYLWVSTPLVPSVPLEHTAEDQSLEDARQRIDQLHEALGLDPRSHHVRSH